MYSAPCFVTTARARRARLRFHFRPITGLGASQGGGDQQERNRMKQRNTTFRFSGIGLAIGPVSLLSASVSFAQTVTFAPAANIAVGGTSGGNPSFPLAVGDFNGDGHPDLAVANVSANSASILLGNGAGTFPSVTTFAVGMTPLSVTVGDFNGDGRLDLATANSNSNTVSIRLGNGSGGFVPAAD